MSSPAPLLCTECVFFSEAQTTEGPRRWCTQQRFHGTITEPEPRCAGMAFERRRAVRPGSDHAPAELERVS